MPDWIKILAEVDYDPDDWMIYMEHQCPNCLWETDPGYYDDPDIEVSAHSFESNTSWEMPFSACDWIERWKCPECGTVFEFNNSNY